MTPKIAQFHLINVNWGFQNKAVIALDDTGHLWINDLEWSEEDGYQLVYPWRPLVAQESCPFDGS